MLSAGIELVWFEPDAAATNRHTKIDSREVGCAGEFVLVRPRVFTPSRRA